MATFAQIKEMRLSIKDPVGYIDIIEVADVEALPTTPVAQTLYFVTELSEYQEFLNSAWARVDVGMSDSRISSLIDLYGKDRATVKIVKELLIDIGKKLPLAKHSNGSENFEYQKLMDIYSFYKSMIKDFEEEAEATEGVSTGRYASTKKNLVGGML